jgi:hypothetical protein
VKIPRYWAKATHEARDAQGRVRSFACWRWSDASVAEAGEHAKARAMEIARRFLRTCKLVREIGPGRIHPDVQLILSVHDRLACQGADRRLAYGQPKEGQRTD